MKSLIFYLLLIGFAQNLWAIDYIDTLKRDLDYFVGCSDRIDFVIVDPEDNPVDLNSQKMRSWIVDCFGSENGIVDFMDRIEDNLKLLAANNNLSHTSREDYIELMELALDFENKSPTKAPFKCHDRYKEDFQECLATLLMERGSGEGLWAGLGEYGSSLYSANKAFDRCLKENY